MKIITIAGLKGGVGKTNFCFNLACFLALIEKKKVLVIDLDPQGNLTRTFDKNKEKISIVKKIFLEPKIDPISLITKTKFPNIWIIPTNMNQENLELDLAARMGREFKLKKFFDKHKTFFEINFDYILIDNRPGINIVNTNALICSDSIISITDNSKDSLNGLKIFYYHWQEVCEEFNLANNFKAIILNMFDNYKISKNFRNEIKNNDLLKNLVVNQEIKNLQNFRKSQNEGKPYLLFEISPDKNPYFQIVEELKTRKIL